MPQLVLPIQSGISSAILFVAVDVFSIFAIFSGLMTIQGYILCRALHAGKTISLKRTRMSLFGSELLVKQSYHPHWLAVMQLGMLCLVLFASIGVNGESRALHEVIVRPYISTIHAHHLGTFEAATKKLRPRIFLKCKQENANNTHVDYWAGAFYATENATLKNLETFQDENGRQRHVDPTSLVCQDHQNKPMLSLSNCMPVQNAGCSAAIDDVTSSVTFYPESDMLLKHMQTVELEDVVKFRRKIQSSTGGVVKKDDVIICMQAAFSGVEMESNQLFLNCFLIRDNNTNNYATAQAAFGRIIIDREILTTNTLNTVPFNVSTAMAHLYSPTSTTSGSLEMLLMEGLHGISLGSYSLSDAIDAVVVQSVIAAVVEPEKETLYEETVSNFTVISEYSWVVSLCLLFLSLIAFIVNLITIPLAKRQGIYIESVMKANEYDAVSSLLRSQYEGKSLTHLGKTTQLCLGRLKDGTLQIKHCD